jgi:hypothetical protein
LFGPPTVQAALFGPWSHTAAKVHLSLLLTTRTIACAGEDETHHADKEVATKRLLRGFAHEVVFRFGF